MLLFNIDTDTDTDTFRVHCFPNNDVSLDTDIDPATVLLLLPSLATAADGRTTTPIATAGDNIDYETYFVILL